LPENHSTYRLAHYWQPELLIETDRKWQKLNLPAKLAFAKVRGLQALGIGQLVKVLKRIELRERWKLPDHPPDCPSQGCDRVSRPDHPFVVKVRSSVL